METIKILSLLIHKVKAQNIDIPRNSSFNEMLPIFYKNLSEEDKIHFITNLIKFNNLKYYGDGIAPECSKQAILRNKFYDRRNKLIRITEYYYSL